MIAPPLRRHVTSQPLSPALISIPFQHPCLLRVNIIARLLCRLECLCIPVSEFNMSGQSSQRPLTLTEELEKLEQSITLTLQGKQRPSRILIMPTLTLQKSTTTSVKPIASSPRAFCPWSNSTQNTRGMSGRAPRCVHHPYSRKLIQPAQFWKQFFEASANVSLSGYEEHPNEETTEDQTTTDEDPSNMTQTTSTETETEFYETPSSERHRPDELDLSSLSISSHSTPRPPSHAKPAADDTTTSSTLTDSSPYETLRKQIKETDSPFEVQDSTSTLPSTPGRKDTTHLRSHGFDPDNSSPFVPPASHEKPSTAKRYQKPTDPVLHHMLDKTYRVQATPLGKGKAYASGTGTGTGTRSKFTTTPKPSTASNLAFDDSPLSSPEPEAPQLHSEIFSSPIKGVATTPTPRRQKSRGTPKPKPGTSVLSPAKGKEKGKRGGWDSDDDFDDDGDDDDGFDEFGDGLSPPKTMQFHVPQSRLMKTPGMSCPFFS